MLYYFCYMIKRILIFIWAITIGLVSFSQTIKTTVKGSVTGGKYSSIKIWSTIGKVMDLVDSTKIQDGKFEFKARHYKQGMYIIGVNDNNHVPVILDNEPIVEIALQGPKLENNLKYLQSAQNIAYIQYIPKENKLNAAIRSAHKKEGNDSTLINLKENELSQLRDSLRQAHPGTFLNKLIGWKSDVLPLSKKTFWNNFDFSDTAIVRCAVLNDRIQRYMRKFSNGQNSGYIQCAEEILSKAQINEVVYEFAVYQMITGFFESGMDNICAYLIDNHLNSESCGEDDIHKLLTKTASSIQQLTIGNTPPSFSAALRDGKAFDLKKEMVKNKYTIIMFWSSWCTHCKDAAPDILAFDQKYRAQKIQLVGYSIDEAQGLWEKALDERQFTFPNIFGGKGWASPVAKLYKVNKTPMFFVIDSKGVLKLKGKTIQEVEKFIQQQG
jgi:thiol-disulfide isomerase/thioredoxin